MYKVPYLYLAVLADNPRLRRAFPSETHWAAPGGHLVSIDQNFIIVLFNTFFSIFK